MSSIVLTILYYLTDGLITESFSGQISVNPLLFPVVCTARIKSFLPEYASDCRLFTVFFIADFKSPVYKVG